MFLNELFLIAKNFIMAKNFESCKLLRIYLYLTSHFYNMKLCSDIKIFLDFLASLNTVCSEILEEVRFRSLQLCNPSNLLEWDKEWTHEIN